MKTHLSNLLPQSPDTQIPTHLKYSDVMLLIEFTVANLIRAINAFYFEHTLHLFDPHVGETSCQIRAYQVLRFAKSIKSEDSILMRVRLKFLHEIMELIQVDTVHYQKIDHSRREVEPTIKTLGKFIKESGYNFELSNIENFLVQSYILTYYKKITANGDPSIDINKIMQDIKISKSAAKRLTRFYQINLSNISCNFISSLLQETPEVNINLDFLNALKYADDDGRSVFPCYLVMKVLWQHMKKNKCIILLSITRKRNNRIIDKLNLYFQLSNNGATLIENFQPKEASYIIDGIMECSSNVLENRLDYIIRVLKTGIEKIILSNMAIHPQYSGKKLSALSNDPFALDSIIAQFKESMQLKNDFLYWRNEAKKLGCGIQNPTLFYIVHMFCGKNIINNQYDLYSDTLFVNDTTTSSHFEDKQTSTPLYL
ncbi:MAG TPA: hypothetical protein VHE99_08695 [Gammaproteobacteria bacterium]|nr:hypothetical protein [Gammaproteobacteria bacterium]